MPGRIFRLDFARVSHTQLDPSTLSLKGKSTSDIRRPSMDHILKRPALNLAKKHSSQDKKKDRSLSKDKHARSAPPSPAAKPKPIKLEMVMESPPILMIDTPQTSSGALISGRLQVTPNVEHAELESIAMFLECTTTTKRPVEQRCRNCMSQVKDLCEWNFLSKTTSYRALDGMQELPFSQIIPGHLPATTHGQIGSVDYSLHVRARTTTGEEIEYRRELIINRALRQGIDKNSVRVFPPTNLTLHVTLPNVVHPIGEFPVTMRLTGATTRREDTQTRWRLRKLTWRVEEHETAVSPACPNHQAKVGGEGKGIQHESTRDLGMGEMKSGWKTDHSDGTIEGEFMAAMNPSTKPQCGMEAQHGLKIVHNLILELVIAEEWAPNKKPTQATPTGAARVLRTQFVLNVTERSGMGIAWDDEQPPMYEDVPDSPPHYQNERTHMVQYEGDDLHEDVESMTLNQ